MKNIKDFLAFQIEDASEELDVQLDISEKTINNYNKQEDPPNILIMRRKSIRQFPNSQRVALYYVDKINKYVTVPYTSMQWSDMTPEEVENKNNVITEDIVETLQSISEDNISKFINFKDGNSVKVNKESAELILKMLKSLNEENKIKVIDMLYENKKQFSEVVDFAYKNIK
jgi:hypothetical protein